MPVALHVACRLRQERVELVNSNPDLTRWLQLRGLPIDQLKVGAEAVVCYSTIAGPEHSQLPSW